MIRRDLQLRVARQLNGCDAMNDARVLIMRACGISHEELLRAPDATVSAWSRWHARHLMRSRRLGTPIAYLTRTRAFYGRLFFVNRHVLIPRPETELVVKTALDIASAYDAIIDVGTGSGAIAITLATELQRPVTATDISRAALRVARRNARRHNIAHLLTFTCGDLHIPATRGAMLIVANLPYLSAQMLADSPREVRDYEPHIALYSDSRNGLDLYRRLFERVAQLPHGPHALVCEFDPRQVDAIAQLAHTSFPSATIRVLNDDANRPRVLTILNASQ